MDLLQMLLNATVLPAGVVLLIFVCPMLWFYNFCRWMLGFIFPENVKGKVVVVTGASSGIGEQLVYEYAKRQAKLMLVARRGSKLDEVARHARDSGAMDVKIVVADVSVVEDCKKFVDETIHAYGRIDHLVCNAGVAHSFKLEEAASTDVLQKIIDTNFLGAAVYTAYFGLPHLRKSRGKFVVTGSTASWLPVPRMAIYNASKSAVVNFFDTLRVEVGRELGGITIAMPGYIQSEMTMGKFLSPDGSDDIDVDTRDVLVGPSPVAPTAYCARSIISGALRGRRYVVVPPWYKVSLLFRLLAPEMLDAVLRVVFLKEIKDKKPLTKTIMDTLPGVEKVVYPPGMQQKTD